MSREIHHNYPELWDVLVLLLASAFYFKGMLTVDRDLREWLPRMNSDDWHKEYASDTTPPLSVLDVQVVASSIVFVQPFVFYYWMKDSVAYCVLLYFSIGVFLRPLLVPSASEPTGLDLQDRSGFVLKYGLAKLDIAVKTALGWAIVWVILCIPFVGSCLTSYAKMALPVPSHMEIEHALFDSSLTPVAIILFLAILLMKTTILMGRSVFTAFLALIGLSMMWTEYQWLFGEVIAVDKPKMLEFFAGSAASILVSDFMLSELTARFERLKD